MAAAGLKPHNKPKLFIKFFFSTTAIGPDEMSKMATPSVNIQCRSLFVHLVTSELCELDEERGVTSEKMPPQSWGQFIQSNRRRKWKDKRSARCIMGTFYDGAPLCYCSVVMVPPESRKCSFGPPFSSWCRP